MITIRDLLTILDAKVLCGEEQLDEEVRTACGSDLMSDVLAFVKDKSILITGLIPILRPAAFCIRLASAAPTCAPARND